MQLTNTIPIGVDSGVTISAPPSSRRAPTTDASANGIPVEDHDEDAILAGPRLPSIPSGPAGAPQPRSEGSWTFAAIGDYGVGSREQAQVAASLIAQRPAMVITLGDNVYNKGREKEYQKRWDPPELFGTIRSTIPVFPALGNHDVVESTEPYFRRFPELSDARYYSYHRGGVHFLAVDSNQSLAPGSDQHAWLERELAASTDPFRVMYLHHPLRSTSLRQPGSRLEEFLGPLLARHGVDLVLAGHEHQYERSGPMNDYGTVHVLDGTGGARTFPFLTWPAPWTERRSTQNGHVEVEVRGDALVGRHILRDGSADDTFTIPRQARRGAGLARTPAA